VSCDTVVVNDGVIIGKPKDREDAKKILKSLSGSRHRVISAVCICKDGKYHTKTDTTYVKFRKLSDDEIENYIDERKPYDKAGSYGIQDEKFDFVESIEGSMYNVVGFPIEVFKEMISGLA
jgi:septum formation protein